MLPGRDERTNNEQGKIELLSQWTLEAEFRNCECCSYSLSHFIEMFLKLLGLLVLIIRYVNNFKGLKVRSGYHSDQISKRP